MINFEEELALLKQKGMLRSMAVVSSASGPYIKIGKKNLLNLCSNNYLGLADDLRLKQAAMKAIKRFGIGSGASRLVNGNTVLHQRLEAKIARFKKQEACLVFPSGYSANLGIICALANRETAVFSDRLNHASIVDGIILSRAELFRYPHRDVKALEEMLIRAKAKQRLIVTDSVFSMDGDIAPLKELQLVSRKYDCALLIDEAHAAGVLGADGRGALQHLGLKADKRTILMGTLSKAFGCAGGFICGTRSLKEFLINKCRPFIFTTAVPAGICASSLRALQIIEKEKSLRQRLRENADFVRENLCESGFNTLHSETPIIPVLTKEPRVTMEFSRLLFREGIFVQGIRPPTVPEGLCRLRLTVMAAHKKKDLENAIVKITKIGKILGII